MVEIYGVQDSTKGVPGEGVRINCIHGSSCQ